MMPNAFDDIPDTPPMMALPVQAGTQAAPTKAGNAFDDITPPVPAFPKKLPVTAADRLQAGEAGILRGAAYLATSPLDAVANAANVVRAGIGTGYGLTHTSETQEPLKTPGTLYPGGLYHFIAPDGSERYSKSPPPAGSKPVTRTQNDIPSALQVDSEVNPVAGALTGLMDKSPLTTTQLARPDDTASRYLATASSLIPAGLLGGGGAVGPSLRVIGGAAPSAVAGQAVMEGKPFGDNNAANTAASAVAQLALALGAPAATKFAIRGSNPQAMQETVGAFRDVGAEPTLAQASGTAPMRFLESALSKIPGSAGVFRKAAEEQAGNIGQGVSDIVESLSPDATFEGAGRAITAGVKGPGGALEKFTERSQALYDELDKHIPGDQNVSVRNTLGTLNKLAQPITGAENTSAMLVNPKISSIREALLADVGDTGSPQLPYEALKGIRSQVGEMLGGSELVSGVSRGQLKRLYGSLSSDMQQAARDAGPQAERAFNAANYYYKNGVERMDMLSDLLDKQGGPEAVFNSAMSGTRYGASKLRDVLESIGPEQQNVVAATVLKRMGTASPGQQNAAGDAFSPQTFLSNWHRMSPEAKEALFGDTNNPIRSRLENVATVAGNLRAGSKVFANPSGTAGAEEATHSVRDLLIGMLGGHALAGPHGAVGVLGSAAGAYGLSKAMTSPTMVNWAARPAIGSASQAASLSAGAANLSEQKRLLAQALATGQ